MSNNFQLRYYQRKAKAAAFSGWGEFMTELIHLGTGGGKTAIAAKMIEALIRKQKRCLFLADSNELCDQPLTVINRATGIIPALEKAGNQASLMAEVVVGSAQTLERKERRDRFPQNHFDVILIDEAHRGSDRDKVIADHFEGARVCGFTATPFRSNLRDLSKYYEHVCFSMPMLNLVDEGFAPPLKVLTMPLEIDLSEVRRATTSDGRDYKASDLETTIAPYYELIIDMMMQEAGDRQIIVFLPLVKSSQAFAEICRSKGVAAMHVDGNSEDRKEIIEAFSRKRFKVICNSDLLSTGVDIPSADCLVNISPTRSASKYQQRVGRIMRCLPGVIDDLPEYEEKDERRKRIAESDKPDALILDFLFQDSDFGVMRPAHLVAKNEEEAKAIFEKSKDQKTPEELVELAKLVLAEKEEALVKALQRSMLKGQKGMVTYDSIALSLRDMTLMEWEPTARWHNKKPSEAQLNALAKWGVDPNSIDSMGRAGALLDSLIGRTKAGLSTPKQIKFLRARHVDKPEDLTFEQASQMIDTIVRSRSSFI